MHLDAWLISNKLSLNVAKTQSMLVSTKVKRKALDKSNQNLQVKTDGTGLEVTVVQSGAVLVLLRLIVCKSCKTGLLEL